MIGARDLLPRSANCMTVGGSSLSMSSFEFGFWDVRNTKGVFALIRRHAGVAGGACADQTNGGAPFGLPPSRPVRAILAFIDAHALVERLMRRSVDAGRRA